MSEKIILGAITDAETFVTQFIEARNVEPDCAGFVYTDDFNLRSSIEDLTNLVQASFLQSTRYAESQIATLYSEWSGKQSEYAVSRRLKYLEDSEEADGGYGRVNSQAWLKETQSAFEAKNPAPPKNLPEAVRRKGMKLATLKELEIFCNRYTADHDTLYLNQIRSRIVEEGDYEQELKEFREKLNLNDFESKAVAKWIQNIKRRVLGIPTGTEFALILTGDQGTGKSLFASNLTAALGDSVRKFNVEELSDKDVIGNCGSTAVMIFDEFRVTDRVGLEILKRAITLTKYDYRPAYSRLTKSINSIASFICSSNEELSDLVIDTENRRFIQITWDKRLEVKHEKVYEYYKTINWKSFFDSVPIETDVWSEKEYIAKVDLVKTNVKADEFRDFARAQRSELRSLCVDVTWIAAADLLSAFNRYRKELGLSYSYSFKTLARDTKITGCERKILNRFSCYNIASLIEE
ncbi:MAG: hypothetical protein CVV47_06985 [Spirochaetae bacterium HGW-Spirochaetae-3]|jgi:hypothetical protein|nr:MAG: hypothetical protein CVV47_06985 [Spirochaetae bacterium HGW-Spirochaetae-3]